MGWWQIIFEHKYFQGAFNWTLFSQGSWNQSIIFKSNILQDWYLRPINNHTYEMLSVREAIVINHEVKLGNISQQGVKAKSKISQGKFWILTWGKSSKVMFQNSDQLINLGLSMNDSLKKM